MSISSRPILISVPLGSEEERRSAARYHWFNDKRGSEPFVIIQYTHSGSGIFRFSNQSYEVTPGKAFIALVPEKSDYYLPKENKQEWVFSWMNCYGPLGLQLWSAFRDQFGCVVDLDPKSNASLALAHITRKVSRRLYSSPFQASEDVFSFYMKWWEQLTQRADVPEKAILNAVRFCEENFREPLTVKELSALCGMSREHFTRLFTRQLKCSPATFLRNERLKAALELVKNTSLPVSEISLRCGFYSPRHFSRAFLRKYGSLPRSH